jgi:glyoxylase-like metal-dependent hydrolase (beta-lactamase superfamily II)
MIYRGGNMEIKKIGNRGTLFTFYDLGIPTNIYVINAKRYVYILDTYLGPDIMQQINEYIFSEYGNKQIIVVNSHGHWDHIWGNSLYSNNIIIAHVLCKEYIQQNGQNQLVKYREEYAKGNVVLTYPNLLFTDTLQFEEDNILMFYSPGHTEDQISVIDYEDKVLFSGDNLERPIPYLMTTNLDQYAKTLGDYINLDVDIVIGGHTECEDKKLIQDNLNYVKKVIDKDAAEFENGEYEDYHLANMKWLEEHNR